MGHINLKTLLVVLFSIIFAVSCQENQKEPTRNEQIEVLRNSVVTFRLIWNDGKEVDELHYGTGFFIGEDLIATAAHVNNDLSKKTKDLLGQAGIFVESQSYSSSGRFLIPVSLEAVDEKNDIAIFSFDPHEIKKQWENFIVTPLLLSEMLPDIGDEIVLTGFHSEFPSPFSSVGTVAMITGRGYFKREGKEKVLYDQAIYSDATVLPGHSGGPLYSLKSHTVVGINVRVVTPTLGMARTAIATNSLHMRVLLESVKAKRAGNQNESKP